MKIYVAGTVLRDRLEQSVYEHLDRLYRVIHEAASKLRHTAQLPYPDTLLDQMSEQEFHQEIKRRIKAADSVITVLDPPNEAVAFEAHFAAQAGKPQVILVESLERPPQLPVGTRRPVLRSAREANIEQVIQELAKAVALAQAASVQRRLSH